MNSLDVYAKITNLVINKLEAGVVPWHRPWNAELGMPRNLVSKNAYRGINVFLLVSLGYESPFFLSFNQVKRLGGSVIKGERSCPVVFWKILEREFPAKDGGVDKQQAPILRYYNVFNIAQCKGIPPEKIPELKQQEREFRPIEEAERIAKGMPKPPSIEHAGGQAAYFPRQDLIRIPAQNAFESDEEYYSTLFHELTHSTGHGSRLNRIGIADEISFGSHTYSKEELIAEMGSAFLCAHAGIAESTVDNSSAYIQGWLNKLRNDRRIVVNAAGAAQKAADHILNY